MHRTTLGGVDLFLKSVPRGLTASLFRNISTGFFVLFYFIDPYIYMSFSYGGREHANTFLHSRSTRAMITQAEGPFWSLDMLKNWQKPSAN